MPTAATATDRRHGTVDATPWARAAIGDTTDLRRLAERVPARHRLVLSGRSARGPWDVRLILPGGHSAHPAHQACDLHAAIDAVLEAVAA